MSKQVKPAPEDVTVVNIGASMHNDSRSYDFGTPGTKRQHNQVDPKQTETTGQTTDDVNASQNSTDK